MRLSPPLLLLLLPLSAPALAQQSEGSDVAQQVDVADTSQESASALLAAARDAYLVGDHDEALKLLSRVVAMADAGGEVPPEVLAEALAYQGELAFLDGHRAAAEAAFRRALQVQPDLRLSPYEHPLDVIGSFELVRASVRAELSTRPVRVEPMPPWGFAPFGVPQFKSGHRGRGVAYATLQSTFLAASIGSFIYIHGQVQRSEDPSLTIDDRMAAYDRHLLVRNAVSIPTTLAFYGTWAASTLDAGIAWRRGQLRVQGVGLSASQHHFQVAVSGRF